MQNMMTIHKPESKTGQVVATNSATNSQSSPVSNQTYAVRVIATVATFIDLDAALAAGTKTQGLYLAPNVPEIFNITPGSRVNAIADATGGNLYITELTQ